jgi:hypothetical protein
LWQQKAPHRIVINLADDKLTILNKSTISKGIKNGTIALQIVNQAGRDQVVISTHEPEANRPISVNLRLPSGAANIECKSN